MLGRKHLMIPDTQCKEGISFDYLAWVGEYIVAKQPDVVVQIGDFNDMPSLCSYDVGKKNFEGKRYKSDICAGKEAMRIMLEPMRKYNAQHGKNKKKQYNPEMILTLGNHEDRITRAIESDPKLDGTLSLNDLGYKEAGWEVYPFLRPVVIDGVIYSHFFPSGQMGRPCSSARALLTKHHMSCLAGHQQGRDIAYGKRADGKSITAIIAGSYYEHDENYLSPFTNKHWRGVFVLHETHDGEFDEMSVSIGYLKRKYG